MSHARVRQSLYDFAHGTLDAPSMKAIDSHLSHCNSCFGEYQVVRDALRLVAPFESRPSDQRDAAYWGRFADGVLEKTSVTKKVVTTNPLLEEILSFLFYRRALASSAAAMATVVVIGVLVWSSGVFRVQPATDAAQNAVDVQVQPVNLELADYYRRSKILLVGISNIEPADGQRIDLSVERQAAHQLIVQTRNLESKPLDDRSRALVRALERILIELANMEQQADLKDVEIVKTGIHQENMLFKIRMAESEYTVPQTNGDGTKN